MSIDPARIGQTIHAYSWFDGQEASGLYTGAPIMFHVPLTIAEYSSTRPGELQRFTTTTDETNVTVGAVAGVEYFPVAPFSIGGEISFNYIRWYFWESGGDAGTP
jgi:hypothetical protein